MIWSQDPSFHYICKGPFQIRWCPQDPGIRTWTCLLEECHWTHYAWHCLFLPPSWYPWYHYIHSPLKQLSSCYLHPYFMLSLLPGFSGLPSWLRQWSICLQCGRPAFNPWFGKILWRRKWQPTPVLLPGKSHGRSLVGYSPWGCKESDMTEWLNILSFKAWKPFIALLVVSSLSSPSVAISQIPSCHQSYIWYLLYWSFSLKTFLLSFDFP